MRTVFVTRSQLGLACLEELVEFDADIAKVYTKPPSDEIADQATLGSFASEQKIPTEYVSSVNDGSVITDIKSCDPELLFVVGWSELVNEKVISIPSVAALGMHPSPLPRGRGRAPIAWSLIKGLEETALSCFHLVPEADAGDLVGQEWIHINKKDHAADLYDKVISAGHSLVRDFYPRFENGEVPRTPQNESEATWWPKRTPNHGLIDWTQSADDVYNWIRGQSTPYPGAFSYINETKVTILEASPPREKRVFAQPGTILEKEGNALVVAAWEEAVEITVVKEANGKKEPAVSLLEQSEIEVGSKFTNARDYLLRE